MLKNESLIQNSIVFKDNTPISIFSGDSQNFSTISFLTRREISFSSNSPEVAALNIMAQVVADKPDIVPDISPAVKYGLQMLSYAPTSPIEIYLDKYKENDEEYSNNDSLSVFIEGVFGKIEFQMVMSDNIFHTLDILAIPDDEFVENCFVVE